MRIAVQAAARMNGLSARFSFVGQRTGCHAGDAGATWLGTDCLWHREFAFEQRVAHTARVAVRIVSAHDTHSHSVRSALIVNLRPRLPTIDDSKLDLAAHGRLSEAQASTRVAAQPRAHAARSLRLRGKQPDASASAPSPAPSSALSFARRVEVKWRCVHFAKASTLPARRTASPPSCARPVVSRAHTCALAPRKATFSSAALTLTCAHGSSLRLSRPPPRHLPTWRRLCM